VPPPQEGTGEDPHSSVSAKVFRPFLVNHNIPRVDSSGFSFADGSIAESKSLEQLSASCAGNIGNSFDPAALLEHLGVNLLEGIQNIHLRGTGLGDSTLASQVNDKFTHVVLFLQDNVRSSDPYNRTFPFSDLRTFIARLRIPIVTVGLGLNSVDLANLDSATAIRRTLSREQADFLEQLATESVHLGVRGEATKNILSLLVPDTSATVIGLPSYFRSDKSFVALEETDLPGPAGSLRDGVPYRGKLKSVASSPFSSKAHRRSEAVLSDDYDWGLQPPGLESSVFHKSGKRRQHVPSSLNELEKLYQEFDFVFGSRLHGTIAALNAGTRALLLNDDLRVREFASLTKIPFLPRHIGKHLPPKDLLQYADYSNARSAFRGLRDNYFRWLRTSFR